MDMLRLAAVACCDMGWISAQRGVIRDWSVSKKTKTWKWSMKVSYNFWTWRNLLASELVIVTCASITTCHGQPLHWVSALRYLGVFIVSSRSFRCSLVYAKRSFYAAANGLFGKLLNLASDEVILELVRIKCTPILLYGLECFQLGKADQHSLDFTFNRLCMKLFKTGSVDVIKDCQS